MTECIDWAIERLAEQAAQYERDNFFDYNRNNMEGYDWCWRLIDRLWTLRNGSYTNAI